MIDFAKNDGCKTNDRWRFSFSQQILEGTTRLCVTVLCIIHKPYCFPTFFASKRFRQGPPIVQQMMVMGHQQRELMLHGALRCGSNCYPDDLLLIWSDKKYRNPYFGDMDIPHLNVFCDPRSMIWDMFHIHVGDFHIPCAPCMVYLPTFTP